MAWRQMRASKFIPPGNVEGPRRTIPLSWALALSFGGLVATAVLGVLVVLFLTAGRNTVDLLQDKGGLVIRHIVTQVETLLEPPRDQVLLVGRAIGRGDLDPRRGREFNRALYSALAGLPQVRGIAYVDRDHQLYGLLRYSMRFRSIREDRRGDETLRAQFEMARQLHEPQWSPPTYLESVDETVLILRHPVRRNDQVIGLVVAIVSVQRISEDLGRFTSDLGGNAFILYGRNHVLAHVHMFSDADTMNARQPLPRVGEFSDPILARIWDEEARVDLAIRARPPLKSHGIEIGTQNYVFLYTESRAHGSPIWLIGGYFPAETIGTEIMRLLYSGLFGLGVLALAIGFAFFMGRRIARPVRRLADAARQVSTLRVEEVEPVPPSRVRELNDQSNAFNAMTAALGWFGNYVPRRLVGQLLRYGDVGNLQSDRRAVTVMFTDIVDYSLLSENQSAAEVAGFLNRHFTILTRATDAENGTVDKFIGDSLMAFWGAPDKQKNRAVRACRAALAIRAAMEADNAERVEAGEAPVRVRIGIHSGYATVGNIGTADRVNYTIIGDTVNVAQRMEQLGREAVGPEPPTVAILISKETRDAIGKRFAVRSAGFFSFKGHAEPMEVFSLEGLSDA